MSPIWMFAVACSLPALAVSLLVTAGLRVAAPRWGLLDHPADRKVHRHPTPLGGGLGIWAGVVVPLAAVQITAWLVSRQEALPAWLPTELAAHVQGVLYRSGTMWAILAGGTVLTAVGLLDDIRALPWPPRLLLQFIVATAVVSAGVRITLFVEAAWFGGVLSVLWIVVLVNAFNFLDNMDGLSAGVALIASMFFGVVMLFGTSEPRWLVAGTLFVFCGALAGFLWHNWPPARIFMGDAGSQFIGLLLASLTMAGTFYEYEGSNAEALAGAHVMLAPLCILAVPLYDFCSVVWIRLREGRSPFRPDKSHFSHRLVEIGLAPPHAVLTIHLATLTTGLGGLLLFHVSGWTGALLIVALVVCVLTIVAILEFAGLRTRRENS